jgi:pimeloyl-ACP methyl ester carboxylesterase
MELFYRQSGTGQPLIVLHGLFGISDNWTSLGKQLSEHFSVYLIDLRNHGQSPHSEEFSYAAMSNDLLEFIQMHQLENVLLMGHSMGGKVAMLFASQYPELLEKLIVVDIGPKPLPPHHDAILAAMLSLDLDKISSRKEADEQLASQMPDFGMRQFILKNLYWKEDKLAWRMNLPVISRKVNNVCEALPPTASFSKPTLFIRGALSNYILDSDWDAILSQFPSAALATIPQAGHWVHAEQPKLFYDRVMGFLK